MKLGKKKKSSLRFLRYKNLTQELARYGYEFTPKKALIISKYRSGVKAIKSLLPDIRRKVQI